MGLVLFAAIVGFGLARAVGSGKHDSPPRLDRTASTAAFSVRHPSSWHSAAAPSLPGLMLGDELTIGPSGPAGGRLAIGTVRAATVGTLPAALARTLSGHPRPESVQLGAFRYDRYLDLRPRGTSRAVSVYLLATTRSTVVATCTATGSGSGTAFAAECERVLSTLRLAGAAPSVGVDVAYALALNAVLITLNRVRSSAGPGLRAADLATRAQAADRLGHAESSAADAARRLSAGSAAAANRMLVGALRDAARGYRTLATAARGSDRTAYVAAQHTLTAAQQTLTEAFKRLAALGYRLR